MAASLAQKAHLKARQSVTMSARCASVSCSAAATPRHMAGPSLPSATRTFSTTAVATNFFTLLMLVSAALHAHAPSAAQGFILPGAPEESTGPRPRSTSPAGPSPPASGCRGQCLWRAGQAALACTRDQGASEGARRR